MSQSNIKSNSTKSLDRQALLELLMQEEGLAVEEDQRIPRRGSDAPVLLSYAQQRLWVLEQIEPESGIFNIFRTFRMRGNLDVPVLEQCLNEILRRHEALRTRYTAVNGTPYQIVMPHQPYTLPFVDLSGLPASEKACEIERHRLEEAKYAFDLTGGLLLKTLLVCESEDNYLFLVSMHHIASDGWSLNIFDHELLTLYDAFINNEPSPLPELPIQYADFAQWQQTSFKNEETSAQLAYWQEKLSGELLALELPTDFARPLAQTYRGEMRQFLVPVDLSEAVKKLSQQRGVTLFMTLLAVFKLLLYRYTGQEDIIVGSPIAGRDNSEIESLIGCFLNTLVLRTDVSDTPSFDQLLERVQKVCVDAYANQSVPFEKLLEVLQPDRDLSRTPLFQVFFNMLNFEDADESIADFNMEALINLEVESKFDMTLYIEKHQQQIALSLVYNPDLFTSERMSEMLAQYVHLLEQIVANPDVKISDFSLLTQKGQAVLPDLHEGLDIAWRGPVHEMVSKHAQNLLDHLAVADDRESVCYLKLEERSNQLAHYLLASGVQPQDVVVVYAHRSVSLVWALLGIMKAGGAFVILDPAYPSQRLIDYVNSSHPKGFIHLDAAGVVPEELETCLAAHSLACRLKLTSLTDAGALLGNYPNTPPDVCVGPDDLAYIAFTSGSTGKPKAIMGRHGSLSHFLPWQQQEFELTTDDRFSMLSGLSHDPLQRDVFTSLWVGATLYVPEPNFVGNSRHFAEWMAHCGITFAHMTPPMNTILTETAVSSSHLPALRYAFFVGDKVTKDDVLRLRKLAPQVSCINSYGSTETQRAVAYNLIPPEVTLDKAKAILPVGCGMPDVQLAILNEHGQQAGIGELGEIYVRSPHLAGGYLNDAELTAQRFLRNPWTSTLHDRMYRSGDLGRYLPDGKVEFVGRNDRQVKIRGFRIELCEVESVLTQHPSVEKGIVVLHEDGQQLVAYAVVPEALQQALQDELRTFLAQRLPHFMLPSIVMMLDKLPLTPNGKIDFCALPQPEVQTNVETLIPPRTKLENELVAIWKTILNAESIGIRDNFFTLGGHSLLAVRLFVQIEQKYDVNLPLVTLFQGGTIEHLAQQIEQQQGKTGWTSIVQMQPDGEKRPFFCVHGITGDLLWFRELAQLFGPKRPFVGLRSHGLDGVQAPFETIAAMAAHYISEMRQLQPEGPYYIGGASFGGTIALEMAQQLKQQGDEVALLVMFDHAPHNAECEGPGRGETAVNFIKNAPLWASSFVKLGPQKMAARLQRKARNLAHEASAKLKNRDISTEEITADDILDYASELPQHRRTLIEKNFYAMKEYIPQKYDGSVLVIKAQAQSLFTGIDPVEGWKYLSTGNMQVQTIPGSHESIFNSPNVEMLAEHLQTYLDEA